MKKLYIDAYNVLHKMPRLAKLLKSDADAARRNLVQRITAAYASKGDIVIVFDGHGEQIASGRRIRVMFAESGNADRWIRMRLEKDTRVRNAVVVSSDREVMRHAKAMGAQVQSAEEFIAGINRPHGQDDEGVNRNRGLSDAEVTEWLDLFQNPEA